MSQSHGEADHPRESIREMIKDCELMQDGARALQVRSAISHDEIFMSLVPFLLSLSEHEEKTSFSGSCSSSSRSSSSRKYSFRIKSE